MRAQTYNRIMESIEKTAILVACVGITLELFIAAVIVWDLVRYHN